MKTRLFRYVFIVTLTAVLALMPGLQTFAATMYYVEDIVVATGSSLAAAKKNLPKDYTMVGSDVNSNNDGVVIIGVKKTTDRSKAITDLRIMNEEGGYSFEDYENALSEMSDAADEMVDIFYTAICEFRENYKNGKTPAKIAYALLNSFTDEDFTDRDNRLGCLLVDETITREQLSVIFMQATSLAVATIESCLGLGCSSDWLTQFVNFNATSTTYDASVDEKARVIFGTLERFQEDMKSYEVIYNASGLQDKDFGDDTDAESEAWESYYESLNEEEQEIVTNYANTYDYLKITKYGNGTLLDFFMQDLESMDNAVLYPLASVMTDGQIATLPYASFANAIQFSIADGDILDDMLENAKTGDDTISIFDGVDRSIFNSDGIALTNEAKRYATSSSDTSWWKGNLSKETENIFYGVIGTVAGIGAVGAAIAAYATYQVGLIEASIYQLKFASLQFIDTGIITAETTSFGLGGELSTTYEYLQVLNETKAAEFRAAASTQAGNSAWGTIATAAKIVTAVAIAIVLITIIIYLVEEYKAYNKKKENYLVIPRIMVDQTFNDDDSRKYTYYYAVKDTNGEYADLNNWDGTQWNALYYTKDTSAGDPILASALVQNSNISKNSTYSRPVAAFGETVAYNLNKYCDNKSGIYMFFQSAGATTATSVSYGSYAISGAIGVAIGAVGAVFATKLTGKKKEANEA